MSPAIRAVPCSYAAGRAPAKRMKGAKLIVYPGAPHGFTDTHKDKFNADLLWVLRE